MARGRKYRTVMPAIIIDATPERIAMAMAVNDDGEILDDGYTWTNAAEIDPREQAINRVRRFQHTMLDRLHRNHKLTWVQWYAGDTFRSTHARAQLEGNVVSSYGERTSKGEIAYGLPHTIGQLNARQRLREYRDAIPKDMRGFMERFLIRDALPRYGGRAHFRQMTEIRKALDELAAYMRLT
jgi:hypothetical protein